jgi:heme/copper-type cytochrome/quinol oxidase subunit 2
MNFLFGLIGIVVSILMLKYRERFGDLFGEAEWMQKIGGIYLVVVYAAIIIFIISFSVMFGLSGPIIEFFIKPVMPWVFDQGATPL